MNLSFSALELGLAKPLLVRREVVDLGFGKKVLYASDLHLRSSNQDDIFGELSKVLACERPDFFLLGGDLADHKTSLNVVTKLVRQASDFAVVGAVPGNHDSIVGRKLVRDSVLQGGGYWLPDGPLYLEGLSLLGSPDQFKDGSTAILCSHYPTDFGSARKLGIPLILAGHLHGWQIVLGEWGEYLYPGALLSRWNGLRFKRNESTMLVSRGMTDMLPLRWNCPREVILVEI